MPSRVPCDVGLNPGNCLSSSGMDGGVVFMPGVPGFPPGASWTGDETDSQFKESAKQRSQADSCSGDALPSHSAQHQNVRFGPPGLRSLGGAWRSGILPALGTYAGSRGMGNPSLTVVAQEWLVREARV